ncbi:MAG TPA: DUF3168 domain-containing protein [Burkholderiales bacterium]|nr:DUF3168 domain-containing protein [Burkholderiales bacterium]HUY04376.1 DUF3168 domain-containing protein [Rhodocyclaceae bacterium]
MSLESTMLGLLGPLVSGRAYPDITPDSPTFPLIVYQQIGGKVTEFIDQTLPDKDHARVQVFVWSRTRLEASQIARAARLAILGGGLAAQTYSASTSIHNAEMKLYGSRTDYGLWYTP